MRSSGRAKGSAPLNAGVRSQKEAVVVPKPDAQWGEVPVAFVARNDEELTAESLIALCKGQLAGYKRPKEIHFVAFDAFPRSTTGKVQRGDVEKWLR